MKDLKIAQTAKALKMLDEIMLETNSNLTDLQRNIGIARSTYYRWANGTIHASSSQLRKIQAIHDTTFAKI